MSREPSEARRLTPLVECVERLHAAGYVVLGPENAEEAAALLGTVAFEDGPVDAAMKHRAEAVLAAFPDSLGASREPSA